MDKDALTHLDETVLVEDDFNINVSSRHLYLIVFVGQDSGKRYKIKQGTTTIGRSSEADITLEDELISRIHCAVEWKEDVITIEDRDSKNGTYVDSKKIKCAHLRQGAPLQVGQSVMKIEYKTEAEIRLEDKLLHSASIDSLTGIFNRELFMKRAEEEIAYARRHKQTVGIIMIDIDHFKQVNDTYGHPMGDSVLKKFAAVVSEEKRTEDVFARYGGEEFIIMPRGEIHKTGMYLQCERIRKAVEKFEFHVGEKRIRITASLGFYLKKATKKGELSLTDLISEADRALYLAKKKGRNGTETTL